MKTWAILVHGRFDFKSQPDSAIEQIGRALLAFGYDVITLDCDELLPSRIMEEWNKGDEVYCLGYSNGAPQICGIIKDFEERSFITIKLLVLFDPVPDGLGQIPFWPFHKDIIIPEIVEKAVVYIRGHKAEYPGRTQVNGQITIVPMLSEALADHARLPIVAMPEALSLLQGATIPALDVPIPGAETIA